MLGPHNSVCFGHHFAQGVHGRVAAGFAEEVHGHAPVHSDPDVIDHLAKVHFHHKDVFERGGKVFEGFVREGPQGNGAYAAHLFALRAHFFHKVLAHAAMDAESHHDKFGVFGLSRFPELFLLSDLLVFGAQALIR